jgi:hypothetical protein
MLERMEEIGELCGEPTVMWIGSSIESQLDDAACKK